MKRIFALAALLALLLAACSTEQSDARVEDLQQRYAAMSGCDAFVDVAVVRGGETAQYALEITRDGDGTRVAVVEPEALSGVTAIVSGDDALSLSFDGMVLDAGSVDPDISAVNATDIMLRAAATGYVAERNSERFADTDALRLCFETEHAGGTLRVTVWFDAEDAPLYAEIEREGEVLAYLEFTDFTFRDILPAE